MNRLVIIGNGFDLAHGLPTSYRHFIDDYWKSIDDSRNDEFIELELDLISNDFNSFNELLNKFRAIAKEREWQFTNDYSIWRLITRDNSQIRVLNFKNNFFRIICQKNIENWVDIENIYYKILKGITKKSEDIHRYIGDIHQLNQEFDNVKNLLEKYLSEKIEKSFEISKKNKNDNDWTQFYHLLKPISIFNNEHNLRLEFNELDDRNDLDIFFIKERQDMTLNKSNSLLLNFNYTSTLEKYIASLKEGEMNVEINQIHGVVYNNENKINFGFGDEMDDDYKMIENINDNEYLKNFKSFQYLQNPNYSKLLNFIDSAKFQVYIMGHSCGLSDRTLLNTIFEHNYCRSIKVFYHQKNDGSDNYTEITQNISRHFNKKKLMREKIVNKTLCKPLPQIQLPKKEV